LIIHLENQKAELDVAEISASPQTEQASELTQEMATLSHQYNLSSNKVKRVMKNMAKRLDKFVVFMEIYEEVDIWLVEIEKVVDDLLPVSEDYDAAKEQLTELRVSI
jgi:ABC-type transporter Mla subunit MlaD